jgi:hypothetical protein
VFERSQEDGRTIVTDNIADYEPLIADAEKRAVAHHGVVFCSSRQFDRLRPAHHRTHGRHARALLDSDDAKTAPFNRRHWLRRAT